MYRPWGLALVALGVLVLLIVGFAQAQPAGQCTFTWTPSTSSGVDAYRLYGAATQGGQMVGQNFVHILVTAFADQAHPEYTVPCTELSWWKATAFDSDRGAGFQESAFSNEVQVPVFSLEVPMNLNLIRTQSTVQGTATIKQDVQIQKR